MLLLLTLYKFSYIALLLLYVARNVESQAVCESLRAPWNGRISRPCRRNMGSECHFECRRPYVLRGSEVRICQADGTWSGELATCVQGPGVGVGGVDDIRCPPLMQPIGAIMEGTCTPGRVGESCRFRCTGNLRLEGQPALVCLPTGSWNDRTPICRGATGSQLGGQCPALNAPSGGRLVGVCTRATAGDTCQLVCLSGYRPSDTRVLVCQENGAWSDVLPRCIGDSGSQCPSIGIPEGGTTSGSCSVPQPRQSCTVRCFAGYTLVGSATVYCQENGRWSGAIPYCTRGQAGCPSLSSPSRGYTSGTCNPGRVGETCTFVCEEGYTLQGQRTLTCLSNGLWSSNSPICIRGGGGSGDNCPILFPPPNGEFTECDNRPGGRCVVVCQRGYVRSGSRVRTCTGQRIWSGYAPVCTRRGVYGYRVVPLWSLLFG